MCLSNTGSLIVLMTLCTLTVILPLRTKEQKTIEIDEEQGQNNLSCTEGAIPCLSLAYAIKTTGNNTLYIIKSSNITVNTTIELEYRKNISIAGAEKIKVFCDCEVNSSCGLMIKRSRHVMLHNLDVIGCSVEGSFNLTSEAKNFLSGISFIMCENIVITQLSSTQNIGFGLSLINSKGAIELKESIFLNNGPSTSNVSRLHGGGGVMITSSACNPESTPADHCKMNGETIDSGSYSILNCIFRNNNHTKPIPYAHQFHLSYGGGLNILMSLNATGNSFTISGCTFENNTSLGGGGMAISIQDGASSNEFMIHNSTLVDNDGSYDGFGGGGGIKITINFGGSQNNRININECVFKRNTARYGGGTAVSAGTSTQHPNHLNHIVFHNCWWEENYSSVSAAIDLSPDIVSQDAHSFNTLVCFEGEIRIIGNYLAPFIYKSTKFKGNGVFLVTRLNVKFSEQIEFMGNQGTALHLQSSYITIGNCSTVLFSNNIGTNGGAIQTTGFSGIHYGNNVTFKFVNNKAHYVGGAIYSKNTDQHLSFSSHTCFFQPTEHKPNDITFTFKNNTASTHYGNSIYLVSLHACKMACQRQLDDSSRSEDVYPFSSTESCLGNFTFTNSNSDDNNDITTDVNEFSTDTTSTSYVLEAIPGHLTKIPLDIKDDRGMKTTNMFAFDVNVRHGSKHNCATQLTIETQIINNCIKIYGHPGCKADLSISPISNRGAYMIIELHLMPCPPGYIWRRGSCLCSAMSGQSYLGISGCDDNSTSGLLSAGFWAGYILRHENETESEHNLFTSDCPLGYCKPFSNNTFGFARMFLKLRSNGSKTALEEQVCAENRQGTLCGRCKKGTSVYYNTHSYQCREEKYCQYGPLLYVVADLLPLTVLFTVMIAFNISLTSGPAYSVIFMVQQILVLDVTAKGFIQFQKFKVLLEASRIIYSIINIEFFNIDSLSFCLKSDAQTLDIIVMKYVSVLFAIGMIILLIIFMNRCSFLKIPPFCNRRMHISTRYSVVQGLTAFLVICYTQTTRVTFSILNNAIIRGLTHKQDFTVVFLDGESKYFQGDHIQYAIPAIIFLFLIVIPPPFILLCDPVLLKLEDRLCYFRQPWTRIRMKFKPVMDAFQNCFKDHLRWFAGFFFLYRLMILAMSLFAKSSAQYYYMVEALLILISAIQSFLQPFANFKDNAIASLCFCNLAFINFLTLCISNIVAVEDDLLETKTLQWMQVVLIYLPLFLGVAWIVKSCLCWLLSWLLKNWWTTIGEYKGGHNDHDSSPLIQSTASDYGCLNRSRSV